MGDGAVVCMPSQQRDIMERFPGSESAWSGRGFGLVPDKKMKELERKERAQKPEERPSKEELGKGVSVSARRRKGELVRNGELEKGEFVPERSHKGELEKGEFMPDKWRRGELEVGEFVPDEWRKWEEGKPEHGSGRGRKVVLEKGESVPDKWRKGMGEHSQEDYYHRKDGGSKKEGERRNLEKGEHALDKWQKVDKKYSNEDYYQKKEVGTRNQSEQRKRSSLKNDGSVTDRRSEPGSHKHEFSNGKGHSKDHNTSTLKRHCMESENSTRKHHGESGDNSGSKSRRISEDSNSRPGHQDKSHNSSTGLSKNLSTNRYSSSRHHESPLQSRGNDRHGQKPGCLEQSPHDRPHQHHHRDRSPVYSERSPHDRARHHDHRDRTPSCSERSPHERLRHHDRRDQTPARRDRSPHDRARHHDHRDRTPGHLERSPHNSGQVLNHREGARKSATGEKQLGRHEEKSGRRDSDGRDSMKHSSARQLNNSTTCPDKIATGKSNKEKESHKSIADSSELPPPPPFSPPPLPPPPPPVNGFPEDSMEEDMDICDTPPHPALPVEQNFGKWYYLDNYGLERGPSKLVDLKRLVEEGVLPSDHLIKHFDSDRWVTVENATSPLLSVSLTSVVSDALTQMVSPPEASGNLLVDDGDISVEKPLSTVQPDLRHKHDWDLPESLEDLHIEERIDALLNGYDIIPGRELETIGEALKVTFEHVEWENWSHSEGFTRSRAHAFEAPRHSREDGMGRAFDGVSKEGVEARFVATSEKEFALLNNDSSDWFAGLWSCKGGDWKRNDDNVHDRNQKRKLVLNEGYPLCQMPKCGDEDPRWHRRDDPYYPPRNKKLDLPSWAFSWMDDKNESNNDSSKCMIAGRSSQIKPVVARGVRGILLPVVRINACVVKDHGSVSESCPRFKSNERHSSKSGRSHSGSGDGNSFEGTSRSKKANQHDSVHECKGRLNTPKDHVCTVDELSTHVGDWFYLDGAGHEHGPFSFPELQDLVAKGTILKYSSVFRKIDGIWIPITENTMTSEAACFQEEKRPTDRAAFNSGSSSHLKAASFHSSHPQFIGYTCGKLHELVMKSYKSREFAAAINEVLDPWITAKQPKKEMEKHFTFNSSITKSSVVLSHDSSSDKFWRTDGDVSGIYGHIGKRARLMLDESDEDFEQEDDHPTGWKNDISFEDLCGEHALNEKNFMSSQVDGGSWGLLNGHILARIFHFLRADTKSLILSAATCKHWRAAVKAYRSISKQVDLSHLGSSCTDSMFQSIMSDYDKNSITSIILSRCSNISASALEEILHLFPGISSIDVRGCNQFRELAPLFQDVKWTKSRTSLHAKNLEESHSKMKSLKRITDKGFLSSKFSKESISHLDDLGNSTNLDAHDFHLDTKDSGIHTFRQGYYKRTRLPDARKSSAALSRDAQLRQLLRKKSVTAYRKMEEYIGMRLKEIMKENTFEFFVTRVAEIEEKMRNGHYNHLGLSSVKEDISRMCRDALKVKRREDSGDMKQVIMLFFQLAKNLEYPKTSNGRDDMVRSLRDSLDVGFPSEISKYRKKHPRNMNDKRTNNRTNSIPYANGGIDYEPYEIDRELKRSISKSNRRHMGSESETSEENDLTEDDMMSGSEGTTSSTENGLDLQLESRTDNGKDGHLMWDDSLDSISDDREWGARMTKASLVPPVTRKYEVIDKYLVVADEEEVKRKMAVALPEDYDEKVQAQTSGLEESDMEIPEVKDYKPRKMLGVEVIEQEVYGIDPYTHNLLLDSMPDESDWSLVEKQKFIEEVLLRTLNKQVRHFTGSGNTPMVYHLKSVIEEIKKTAEESSEPRLVKLCHAILKAMQSRPDDNYVAYRKGLGVVCNKDGGFSEDDFVVEFLGEVYPAWKWFEKQDGIRSLQKNSKDPAPEFYNIYLERPKGDRDGYDLVVVDAMHKANYASRICHSCRPNCEAKVTAVNGRYQIGIYAVRPIAYGEEITFDYNSVTESKEEYEASVCLCGSQVCRGSYLNLTGEDAFQNILKECHGLLDRHKLILEACEKNSVSQEDYIDLAKAGLGLCLLGGLPDWLIAYSAHLVRFMNLERTKLPEQILKHNLEEKRKFFTDICLEAEKNDAEVQAEGVYNQRLQNLALTLDKVRYVMRHVFGDPKDAPPPLERLSPDHLVSVLWKGEGSLVEELLQCMAPHVEANVLNDLRSKIRDHDPSGSNLQLELRKSLLWLRDELRELPCSYKCRNDAAADLVHIYAYTKCFFRVREYKTITSSPVYISPLDLGPKYVEKMGPGFQEYCKTYGDNYCLGQLVYWHNQANADPDCNLARARRGCLSLPDVASFYTKSQKPSRERIYSPRTLRFLLARMEKQPQRPWPKDQIWVFKNAPRIFGSPMMDAVLNNCPLDKEMMHWLKSRPSVFEAMWDG